MSIDCKCGIHVLKLGSGSGCYLVLRGGGGGVSYEMTKDYEGVLFEVGNL